MSDVHDDGRHGGIEAEDEGTAMPKTKHSSMPPPLHLVSEREDPLWIQTFAAAVGAGLAVAGHERDASDDLIQNMFYMASQVADAAVDFRDNLDRVKR